MYLVVKMTNMDVRRCRQRPPRTKIASRKVIAAVNDRMCVWDGRGAALYELQTRLHISSVSSWSVQNNACRAVNADIL